MKRGSSVLPRLTASSPFKFIAWIFFLFQTSTLRPRPRQRRRAASPRKRAVATDGRSLTRSRGARSEVGAVFVDLVGGSRGALGDRIRSGLRVFFRRKEKHELLRAERGGF